MAASPLTLNRSWRRSRVPATYSVSDGLRPRSRAQHRNAAIGHRDLAQIRLYDALERLDPALPPPVEMRRRQPAQAEQYVDCANELLFGERLLGCLRDPLLQILPCHRPTERIPRPMTESRRAISPDVSRRPITVLVHHAFPCGEHALPCGIRTDWPPSPRRPVNMSAVCQSTASDRSDVSSTQDAASVIDASAVWTS